MTSIGSYQAKTTLPALLRRVSRGERIEITRRGTTVAMLVPPEMPARHDVASVIAAIRKLPRIRGGIKSIADLRHAWNSIIELARTHKLTVYDAAYLDLAIRNYLPLATLDSALLAAAKSAGVRRFVR
jgi:prevent-host-death family protein